MNIPGGTGRWRIPKPSLTHMLATALALSLALSGYLFSRPDVRALVFSPATGDQTPTTPPAAIPQGSIVAGQPGLASVQTSASPDINVLVAQLQDMQNKLLATSSQLEQKYLAAGLLRSVTPAVKSGDTAQKRLVGEDIPALLAEIDQLYQVMQPLMVQLEVANKSASSRPASEGIALRTQLNAIHQRLAYLLARVESAKAQTNVPAGSGSGAVAVQVATPAGLTVNSTASDRAMYDQLYQSIAQFQSILQQMHNMGQFGR